MRSILDKKKADSRFDFHKSQKQIVKSKRSQEMSISTIVILALAVIVLVVVVLGFSKGWNYIFDKIDVLPSGLEAAAQSCGVSASSKLKTSYCNEFKEVRIAGLKQYMNCEVLKGYAEFEPLGEACGDKDILAGELCANEKLKNSTFVNKKTCQVLNPSLYMAAATTVLLKKVILVWL